MPGTLQYIGRTLVSGNPFDNQAIKRLTKKYLQSYLFILSKDQFHPHLEEALRNHIFACISKPIDLEEFFCFLNVVDNIEIEPDNRLEVMNTTA